ncbi:MAG: chromosome segregation protein SMC, partial [Chitinophagales bacterium]|nr:chromosome segregation protein SMC [Chitinophagales bacterium]
QKTKKYYELKEEYKRASLSLSKFLIQDYRLKFETLEQERRRLEIAGAEYEANIAKLEANLQHEKAQNLEKEKALFAVQKKLNDLLAGVGDKENERNLLQSQIKYSGEKAETARQALKEAEEQIRHLSLSLEKLNAEKESESALLEQKRTELAALEENLEQIRNQHASYKTVLAEEQKLYSEKERQIFELEKKLAVNRSGNESLQRDLFQSEQDVEAKRKELEQLTHSLQLLEKQKEDAEAELQNLLTRFEEEKLQIEALEKEIEKLRTELTAEVRLLDAKHNEYELTRSMVENMEGFPEAIKFLKKNPRWVKEAPLLSDIIYCAEEYRVALENYLEPFLSHYVVDTTEDAFAAINLLSEAGKGKANFFILKDFEKFNPSQPLILPGAIAATSLIEIEPKYKKLAVYLLDKVFIVDENASFDASSLDELAGKAVLISKNGRFVRQEYSISGGSVGLFEGKKIGRAKNLEKLKNEIEQLEQVTRALHQRLSERQQLCNNLKASPLPGKIEQKRKELSELGNKLAAKQASIQSLVRFLETADAKSKNISARLQELCNEVEEINQRLDILRGEQQQLKKQLEQADKNLVEITNQLSEASSRFNHKNIEFHQQLNRVNSLTQEISFKTSQIESLTIQSQRNYAVIEECEKQMAEATLKLRDLERSLLQGYADKGTLETEIAEAEKDFYQSRAAIGDLEQQLKEVSRQREQNQSLFASNTEQINELKISLTGLKERLSLEFGIDINEILNAEPDTNTTRHEAEEEVARIKKRLENFGEINPMAIEAYEEIKARYDFIVSQKKDLEAAKNSLMDTIQEIEHTAKERFTEAFAKIRENFIKVFRTLFSEEDQCDLYLVNPDDPLESRIEIVAKPKGKRPTVIDQLSGGEKTLTATALLFSLYLLKPAPFCIFDEVDAPLDDANIAKFNKIIREFSKDSQFIIVTHNKNTMAAVEAIYGVTMPETGVSKVVPVNFSSLN